MAEIWFNLDRNSWAVGVIGCGAIAKSISYFHSKREAEREKARLSATLF